MASPFGARASRRPVPIVGVGAVLSEAAQVTRRSRARSAGPTHGQLDAFCSALSVVTGLEFVGRRATSYQELVSRLIDDVDLAWLPPLVALKAFRQGEATPLVLPVRQKSGEFWSALFCRGDSSPSGPADLRALRVAWVDPQSVSGYLLMRASLAASGVDLRSAFREEFFAGTHDAVVDAVCSGAADVGATFAHLDSDGVVKGAGWRRLSVKILHRAGPIPGDVFAASTRVDSSVVSSVTDAMTAGEVSRVDAAARTLFAARGFAKYTAAHRESLDALAGLLDESDLDEATHRTLPPEL